MKLIPVFIRYKLDSYDFEIQYCDKGTVKIETVGIDYLGNEERVSLNFSQIAELKIFHFNFWEENYGESLIKIPSGEYVKDTFDFNEKLFHDSWKQSGICPDSGLYIVENSSWYESRNIYKELKSRGYFHYLLTGYQSYVELLAQKVVL